MRIFVYILILNLTFCITDQQLSFLPSPFVWFQFISNLQMVCNCLILILLAFRIYIGTSRDAKRQSNRPELDKYLEDGEEHAREDDFQVDDVENGDEMMQPLTS